MESDLTAEDMKCAENGANSVNDIQHKLRGNQRAKWELASFNIVGFAFIIAAISVVKDLGRKFATASHNREHAGRVRSPEFALFLF